ncbi:MAG: cytochrome c-type biogenesis protein CcmH [Gammaproteobacteria bacterium]|nr:cytochrome c-type biogenesis protein CcmH [Gammaproteobacteria bacterium]
MKTLRLSIIAFLFLPLVLQAEDIPFEFERADHEQRYKELVDELRCMVCQNQTLADSHAPLAQDLRNEVYRMIIEDQQKQDIVDFLVQRYGDFVLYKPPLKNTTLLLWFGPFLLLLIASAVGFSLVRSRAKVVPEELNQAQKERLRQLLDEQDSNKAS